MQYPVALQTSALSAPASPEPFTPVSENEPKVIKITNCKILRDHKIVENDAIWIQAGKIIDPHKFFWYQKRLPDIVLDAGGLLVVPGFIEAQINGAFGVDFSVPSDPETYEKDLLKVSRGLLKYGTTSYCPTIVSSSATVYHKVLSHLKPRPGSIENGAAVLGAHVEGPFINKARIGAHELKVLQASAKNGYKDFKDVYGLEGETPQDQERLSKDNLNSVKIITCAPELEGIMDSIPDLVKAGITVSVGHSMANTSQAEEAVRQGATFITHLFNAMPQFHHRDPGVIGLLGSRPDLPRPYYGIICDGIHVHPNSVKIAYDSHPEGVILVTDAMSAMGLVPGTYQLGNMSVTKEEDRVYIEGTDTLAGRPSNDTQQRQQHSHQYHHAPHHHHHPSRDLPPIPISQMTACVGHNHDSDDEGKPSSGDEKHGQANTQDALELSIEQLKIGGPNSLANLSGPPSPLAPSALTSGLQANSVVPSAQKLFEALSLTENDDGLDGAGTDNTDNPSTLGDTGATLQSKKEDETLKKKLSTGSITDQFGDGDGDLCCPSSSVITLDACIRNFIQFTSCTLIEALEAVTLHPAVLLGIQEQKGVIKPGADADLVFLDNDLFVQRVFVAGEEVDLDSIDVKITEKF